MTSLRQVQSSWFRTYTLHWYCIWNSSHRCSHHVFNKWTWHLRCYVSNTSLLLSHTFPSLLHWISSWWGFLRFWLDGYPDCLCPVLPRELDSILLTKLLLLHSSCKIVLMKWGSTYDESEAFLWLLPDFTKWWPYLWPISSHMRFRPSSILLWWLFKVLPDSLCEFLFLFGDRNEF